jgi:hypothetical protein
MEIGKRRQYHKGCATIMVRIDISLPNVHMKGKIRTTIRKRRLARAARRTIRSQRRSLMDKFMSVKNGT